MGTKEEMDGGVNAMKEVMGRFEERSNDQNEKCLDFCCIVFPTVAIHMYRSSPLVPLDSCLTAAACLSTAC